jgi:hypothetical protein
MDGASRLYEDVGMQIANVVSPNIILGCFVASVSIGLVVVVSRRVARNSQRDRELVLGEGDQDGLLVAE